jgi:secreted trypsin-like serine protease
LKYICGGSLISSRTVVSASHCVVDDSKKLFPKDSFRLLFGAVDLKSLSGSEALREVDEIIKHPDYEYDKITKQDIALLITRGNIQFSSSIRPICLFEFNTPITNYLNQSFIVLGFGSSESSKEASRFLSYGQMSIISRQQCIESKLVFGLLPELSAFCAKAVGNMIACPGENALSQNFIYCILLQ